MAVALDALGVEAAAVVLDDEPSRAHLDGDVLRTGVLVRVAHGLLSHPEEERLGVAVKTEVGLHFELCLEPARLGCSEQIR
jgi:hypothetical protein